MNFVNKSLYLKPFYGVLILIIAGANIFAQAEKPKVSADEANMAKKLETAKSFPEKLTAGSDFLKKYPNSSLYKQVIAYLAAQVYASKDDNQSVTNAQSFMTVFTDSNDSDTIVPALY